MSALYGMDMLLSVSGVIRIMTGSRAGCQPQLHIRINWGVPEKDRSPGPCPEPAGHNLWAGPRHRQLELHGCSTGSQLRTLVLEVSGSLPSQQPLTCHLSS